MPNELSSRPIALRHGSIAPRVNRLRSSRCKVVHVLKSAQTEFAAQVRTVCALVGAIDCDRYEFHAALLLSGGPLEALLNAAGVRTEVIGWSGDRRDGAGAWRFLQYLRREKFSILHQHFGGVSGRFLARVAGVEGVILHLHSRVLENGDSSPVRFSCRMADQVIACSRAVARCAAAPAEVIYAGASVLQRNVLARRGRPVIGAAARLVPLKGQAYLLDAFTRLRREFPWLRLQIAGEGPELATLQALAASMGVQDSLDLLGWQPDLSALWPQWDIFVSPSLEEGFGVTVLEAMAAGLPVVATAVGGVAELVVNGETGRLVPARDAESLARALGDLLRDPVSRAEMGAQGQRRVQTDFAIERMSKSVERIYSTLLQHRLRA